MQLNTIDEVISTLQQHVQECKRTKSRAGYFAALYLRMTIAVKEGIRKGIFEDGTRMEKLDVVFAKRYLDAYNAWLQKSKCSASWQCAFDGCGNKGLTVIQQLLLGINTHINLDLAIAAAQTAPGAAIHALHNDFNRINNVIASLTDDMQQCMEQVWTPMKLLTRIAAGKQEAVLNFSIDMARKTAWANATLLAGMNAIQQAVYIDKMDAMVKGVGLKIISPGLLASVTLKLIRKAEYEDIARTITLIETTVVEANP